MQSVQHQPKCDDHVWGSAAWVADCWTSLQNELLQVTLVCSHPLGAQVIAIINIVVAVATPVSCSFFLLLLPAVLVVLHLLLACSCSCSPHLLVFFFLLLDQQLTSLHIWCSLPASNILLNLLLQMFLWLQCRILTSLELKIDRKHDVDRLVVVMLGWPKSREKTLRSLPTM